MNTVDFAVDWWVKYLSGDAHDDEMQDFVDKNFYDDKRVFGALKILAEFLDNAYEYARLQNRLKPWQKEKFAGFLKAGIKSEMAKNGYCYLYTDESGSARGLLGLVSYYAYIQHDEASAFPNHFEMFIDRDKVEIRRREDEKYEILFQKPKEIER